MNSFRKVAKQYNANADDELSLCPGQLIFVIAVDGNDWAEGVVDNHLAGWFPLTVTEIVDDIDDQISVSMIYFLTFQGDFFPTTAAI